MTHFADEQAAFDLMKAVIRQAQKDLVQKRVEPEDRASAKAFLVDLSIRTPAGSDATKTAQGRRRG